MSVINGVVESESGFQKKIFELRKELETHIYDQLLILILLLKTCITFMDYTGSKRNKA